MVQTPSFQPLEGLAHQSFVNAGTAYVYPHPSSSGKTLSYLTLERGSAIISATVSRQVG
jgi:hypothetical protein